MDLLSVMSIGFDTDIRQTSITTEGALTPGRFFHLVKTGILSFKKADHQGQDFVHAPAIVVVDNQGNPSPIDPEEQHTDYCKEITINGSGAIDGGDQTVIGAVAADERLGIHKIFIATTSTGGVINLDFAGDSEEMVDRFYVSEGPRNEMQRHKVSAFEESLKMTGSGLDVGEKIFYAIQAKQEKD